MSDERPEFDHLLHWVPDVPEAVRQYTEAGFPHTPTRRGAMSFAVNVTDAAACGDTAWRRSSPPPRVAT
ncbi:hypothetical protein [Nocardiopsis sp. L17-MgMaSL7]|uniref:hypothetical protein n=1 Tax=Nocardiopsis sp. L17-MgMaSL7 TaxID=1938893 RepID=UPI000D9BBBB4|nr:hypothetical protein [Nocardiopsis sp. L17-MgMaSL7]PWV45998.1 hypothetical protein BDW27_11552 [Nocardiopsis sp. L17-MgMaSL7]